MKQQYQDQDCLGYELDMGIGKAGMTIFCLFQGNCWHQVDQYISAGETMLPAHLTEQSAELAAWTLNNAAALNRCDRGSDIEARPLGHYEWYHPCIGCDGGIAIHKGRSPYQMGIPIRPFATLNHMNTAIASIGGEAVMVKVLQTLEKIF